MYSMTKYLALYKCSVDQTAFVKHFIHHDVLGIDKAQGVFGVHVVHVLLVELEIKGVNSDKSSKNTIIFYEKLLLT